MAIQVIFALIWRIDIQLDRIVGTLISNHRRLPGRITDGKFRFRASSV
jgi:hypothetical protein